MTHGSFTEDTHPKRCSLGELSRRLYSVTLVGWLKAVVFFGQPNGNCFQTFNCWLQPTQMQCTSGKYINEGIRLYCLPKTHRLHATMPKARFQCLKSVGFCTNSNSAIAFSKSLSLHSLLAYLKLESNLTKKDMEIRNQSQHTMTVMSSTTFLSKNVPGEELVYKWVFWKI